MATSTPTAGLDPAQRNAYSAVIDMLKEFGLETLAPKILGYVQQGFDSGTISYELQQTAEWKQRFIANETRKKSGLPVLSPQEYLATERAYRQIMSQNGLPAGFYDQTTDFTKFLEQDIAPAEVQARVDNARQFLDRADPQEMAKFRQFYTTGDMIAFALDPKRAAPLVGKAFNAAAVAGQAQHQGIGIDRATAESLAGAGVSSADAQRGFSLVAAEKDNAAKLAALDGTQFTVNDLIAETFQADAGAAAKRRRLGANEKGRFSGSSGVGSGSLSTGKGNSGL